jgi:predicted TPR repeat methyltransferase
MGNTKTENIKRIYDEAVAFRDMGNVQGAVTGFRAVLRLHPRHMDAHYLLGTIYAEAGDLKQALKHLKAAVKIAPNAPMVLNNLGSVYRVRGERALAAECYGRALVVQPDMAEAGGNLSSLMNDPETDLNAMPKRLCIVTFSQLGTFHQAHGNKELALSAFRRVLEWDAGNEHAKFAVAGLSGTPMARMSESHVASTFDNYAQIFERHLVDTLGYRAHLDLAVLAEKLRPEGLGAVLDLGCGTGLVGAALSGARTRLVGIDLSRRMIEKARARKLYDSLLIADINKALAESEECFETIIAADTFIYLGSLEATFAGVKDHLSYDGVFVFSIETGPEGTPYAVTDGDRYAHDPAYIRHLADNLGFEIHTECSSPLRKHAENWMEGVLYGLRLKV